MLKAAATTVLRELIVCVRSKGMYNKVIGERERANQVVRSFERTYTSVVVRRVSAHARLLTRFLLSEIISKYFTHAASRYAPIDLATERTLLHSTACAAIFGD